MKKKPIIRNLKTLLLLLLKNVFIVSAQSRRHILCAEGTTPKSAKQQQVREDQPVVETYQNNQDTK